MQRKNIVLFLRPKQQAFAQRFLIFLRKIRKFSKNTRFYEEDLEMGLFDKKTCILCGGKVGLLTGSKLADGSSYVCGNCTAKACADLPFSAWEKFSVEDARAELDYAVRNAEQFRTEFHKSRVISAGVLGKSDVLLVDDAHNWFVNGRATDPAVISFDQVKDWKLMLDTSAKDSGEDTSHHIKGIRPGMPVCPPDREINQMKVRVFLNHDFIPYVDLIVMDALFVTKEDVREGYRCAGDLYDLFEQRSGRPMPEAAPAYAQPPVNAPVPPQAAPQPAVSGAADEILKYKQLLDMGVITPAEFEMKKKQLLGL